MELNIPDKVRGWIYVSIIFLMPTLTYLSETGIIGTAEVALVTGLCHGGGDAGPPEHHAKAVTGRRYMLLTG
jgi:hypothetical protein